MTRKYTAVSLVTVSRISGMLEMDCLLFNVRMRTRTTTKAPRSVNSCVNIVITPAGNHAYQTRERRRYKGAIHKLELGKGTTGMHPSQLEVALLHEISQVTIPTSREKCHTRMNGCIYAKVHSYRKLHDGESRKRGCDPLVLPRYRIDPYCEDSMGEQCDQNEVNHFKERRPSATERERQHDQIRSVRRSYSSSV